MNIQPKTDIQKSVIPLFENKPALDWTPVPSDDDLEQSQQISKTVAQIIEDIRTGKDSALRQWIQKLKDKNPSNFKLSQKEINDACSRLSDSSKKVLEIAATRIEKYASSVMSLIKPVVVDNGNFVTGMDFKPVNRVACYVPSGRYPLPSTALMTALTAKVAGVKEICIFTPSVCDEIIYAATLAGVSEIYQVGGAQAIAACTFGTESITSCDFVVGPGNAYVTEAKRQLQGKIGIDMLAGPSEIAIIADSKANPQWLALDLMSQAEHDPDARAYLFCDDEKLAKDTASAIADNLEKLDLPEFIKESLSKSVILVLPSIKECVDKANMVAPEHLQLQVENPEDLKPLLHNYGALFMGYFSTVPFGDYMAGPNHTLPTGGAARFSGALNPLVFLRAQSYMQAGEQAQNLASETAQFARIEGLKGHAAAAECRIAKS